MLRAHFIALPMSPSQMTSFVLWSVIKISKENSECWIIAMLEPQAGEMQSRDVSVALKKSTFNGSAK